VEQFPSPNIQPDVQDELKHVQIANIRVNPYQPRRDFRQDELEELAQSIRSVGILHPPLVRSLPNSDDYELISGERRFRASQMAALTVIPVYIRKAGHSTSALAALIENIQRVDLNPLDIANALKKIMIEFSLTQEQLSGKIGKKRSTTANYLRLLALPQIIQDSIAREMITMGHAKAILSLDREEKQFLLHEMILRDDLNVRQTEEAALRISEKAKKQQLKYIPRDFYLEQLAEKLREKLGTQVHIQGKGKRGRVTIDYYSLDDLDRLLQLFEISL